jgi:hypothetical protein
LLANNGGALAATYWRLPFRERRGEWPHQPRESIASNDWDGVMRGRLLWPAGSIADGISIGT